MLVYAALRCFYIDTRFHEYMNSMEFIIYTYVYNILYYKYIITYIYTVYIIYTSSIRVTVSKIPHTKARRSTSLAKAPPEQTVAPPPSAEVGGWKWISKVWWGGHLTKRF